MDKSTYEPPAITEIAPVAEATLAGRLTGALDADYPEGTPNTPPGIFS